MKFVVGLGNPGVQYAGTRHNVGFDVVRELAKRFGADKAQSKFQAEFQPVLVRGEKVLLIAPLTYMNRSGESVWQFVKFYQPEMAEIVVVCDDMNLPAGRLRWKPSGSAGGQKGLNDIIQRLGHGDFPRLRLGIDRPPGKMDVTSWVLGKFRATEKDPIELAVIRAADSVEHWVSEGIEPTMNKYNRQSDEA